MNKMMRGREGKVGALPSDLLVCFPSRNRLALMPKPARSPARSMDKGPGSVPSRIQNNHHHQKQLHRRHHHKRRSLSQGGKGSPTLWAKTKVMESSEAEEPTSPKVTCVGKIKVKSNAGSSKNWESVMKEIERIHNCGADKKKKPSWIEALGLKKDMMQFFGCFRRAKLDLPCFGSYHPPVLSSDDEDEDEDDDDINVEEQEEEKYQEGDMGATEALFSKWFMVLKGNEEQETEEKGEEEEDLQPCAPPPNALLLMRCRSAPAKTWLEEKLIEEQEQEEARKARLALEEKKSKENLILQYYGPDFYMVSSDIAKETWVVGGTRDPLARSRSWRR